MDRTMFPRTVVEIDLVLDLCDKQRYDLLAAVMSFCCRQTRSLVPCRDFKTMRVWCGVTPQWWARWGVQVVPLIPPLGGGVIRVYGDRGGVGVASEVGRHKPHKGNEIRGRAADQEAA